MFLSWERVLLDFVLENLESNYNHPTIASGKAGTTGAAAEAAAGCSGMLPGLALTRLISGCGFLLWPHQDPTRGVGQVCAWGSKPCPAASKSFLLSTERMLELSFLALPKFILLRAVVVYF